MRQSLLDYAVKKELGLSVKEILSTPINKGEHGKPYFSCLDDIHFSVSHSGDYWACAFENLEIGFDLEDSNRRKNRKQELSLEREKAIAKRFFTRQEHEYISEKGHDAFLKVWVRKEAYFKYKGTGIFAGLSKLNLVEKGQILRRIEGDIYIDKIDIVPVVTAAYCASKRLEVEEIVFNGF